MTLIKHNMVCLGHKRQCRAVMTKLSLGCQLIRKHENATPDGWSMKISLSLHSRVRQSLLWPLGLPH